MSNKILLAVDENIANNIRLYLSLDYSYDTQSDIEKIREELK